MIFLFFAFIKILNSNQVLLHIFYVLFSIKYKTTVEIKMIVTEIVKMREFPYGDPRPPYWSQRFFLIFHRMGELRESSEAANTIREAARDTVRRLTKTPLLQKYFHRFPLLGELVR